MWQKAEIWVSIIVHHNGVRVGEDELEKHLRAGFEPYEAVSTISGTTYYLKRNTKDILKNDSLGWPNL